MAEEKDRIRRAAEALDALGAAGPQDDKQVPPPPAPLPASESPRPDQPAGSPAGPLPLPVPVALRRPGKLYLRRKPAEVEKVPPPPPPPPLTPLAKAMLARKVAFRRTVIPVLLVSGLAMVLLGCWSISVLVLGRVPFQPDMQIDLPTRFFAKLSLLAWPIGVILLGGAIFLMHEVYQYYQTRQGQEPPGGAPKI